MARGRLATTAAAAMLAAFVCLVAACTDLPARPNIASFESDPMFLSKQDDLGGELAHTADMAEFVRATDRGNHLRIRPGSAASAWSAAVPTFQQANYLMTVATGAVVTFDLGGGDPSNFKVAILTRPQGSPGMTPTERYEVNAQLYVPAAASSQWVTVRIPIQHFKPLPNRMLVGIEFRGFASPYGASGTPIRFDNLRIEYRRCPHRLAAVPVQTCRPTSVLVADFTNPGLFQARLNALGGSWSDDGTMSTLRLLSASDPRGPGLMVTGGPDSYWYTFLKDDETGKACLDPWPYTALRVEVAASRGLQLDFEFKRIGDDCVTNANLSAIRVPSNRYVEFTGLDNMVTIDIKMGRLQRNLLHILAISGFYRRPGDPTDGTSSVIVRRMSLVRDCDHLAAELTEPVPPVMDYCGPSDEPLIALSFDGPSRWIDGIMEFLARENIKATFFIQPGAIIDRPNSTNPFNDPDYYPYGYPLQQAPTSEFCRLVKRIINAGHSIGDHTYTHPRIPSLTDAHMLAEIERPYRFYMDCLGYIPSLFRPPYGELTPSQQYIMMARGYSVVQWNLESNDHINCQNPPTLENLKASLRQAQLARTAIPHSAVVLMHDECTNLALPGVVAHLKSLGYKFVTMDECRERCIDRAYPGQPAFLADHRGCQDPFNPSDYSTSQLHVGQFWLRRVDPITTPQPPPLGASYPYMAPASSPFVTPKIV